MVHKSHTSHSDAQTQEIGSLFAEELLPGDTVFLYGDLGFGKTTFVKGLSKGFGIESRVISPTFTVMRSHAVQESKSPIKNLIHVDLYRMEDKKQLEEIGLEELLHDKESVVCLEWPEKAEGIVFEPVWKVQFTMNTDNTRTINIIKHE